VSNFDQITSATGRMKDWVPGTEEGAMAKTDQFWRYAKEAMLLACNAETDEEKQGLFGLARTWTQAALLQRASSSDHDSQVETSAA
jgi:hypothetical protein